MDPRLAADRDALPHLLDTVWQRAAEVLGRTADRGVVPAQVLPEPVPLPEPGTGLREALEEFTSRWEPVLSASAGPRYLGFVTGGVTPAALAGDWMTAAWDQNLISYLDGAGQHLEREKITWVRELIDLSDQHHGAFVSGATMSNIVGLAIAREWLGGTQGRQSPRTVETFLCSQLLGEAGPVVVFVVDRALPLAHAV
ncbi:hypothetical protein AB0945_21885 [Streptomyces sp. NPDC005474]|uniref:hypothetical protein n=1 Tax=Streptomyces sp. NPDC005474 TaxID=3154878 RepID=UPI003455A932